MKNRLKKLFPRLRRGEQLEILASQQRKLLTRFSRGRIHQNLQQETLSVQLRLAKGKRLAALSLETSSFDQIARGLEQLRLIVQHSPPDRHFPGLPPAVCLEDRRAWKRATAHASPKRLARSIKQVVAHAHPLGVFPSGFLSVSEQELLVLNSNGLDAQQLKTIAEFNLVCQRGQHSGHAHWIGHDIEHLPLTQLTRDALRSASWRENKRKLPPGEYPVILMPEAVGDTLGTLAYMGFGARAFQEHRSFMVTHQGKRVAPAFVSVWDEGTHPHTLRTPFDYEGVPKQKVKLIERGIAREVVYDTETAHREGRESTGHALPSPNSLGPMPQNLIMRGGSKPLKEIIADTERAILVTRFHYVNVVEPMKTMFTGLTRDGTFLIERGKIRAKLIDYRFTQSILDALAAVTQLSQEQQLVKDWLGTIYCPAVKISRFQFLSPAGS